MIDFVDVVVFCIILVVGFFIGAENEE